MLVILILPLTILVADCHEGVLDHDRIVGGTPIEIEDAPYQVQVTFNVSNGITYLCGGSIIAKNVILTAGHCIDEELDFKVRVGSKTLEQGGKVYSTSRKKLHEDDSQSYDIGLLWLTENLEYNESVAPIALPSSDDVIEDGTMCNVTGWGSTSEGGNVSQLLLQTTVPIVNQKVCQDAYPSFNQSVSWITDDMICAGYMKEGGKDSCGGDSGGPMVANKKQWGIVSWGNGCARPKFPGVYTRVTYFRKWINQHVTFD